MSGFFMLIQKVFNNPSYRAGRGSDGWFKLVLGGL